MARKGPKSVIGTPPAPGHESRDQASSGDRMQRMVAIQAPRAERQVGASGQDRRQHLRISSGRWLPSASMKTATPVSGGSAVTPAKQAAP